MSGSPSAETLARIHGKPLARALSTKLRISSVSLIMFSSPEICLLHLYLKFPASPSCRPDPKINTHSGCSRESERSSVSWRPALHSLPSRPSDESAPAAVSSTLQRRKFQSTRDRFLAVWDDLCKVFCQLHRRSNSTAGWPQRFLPDSHPLQPPAGGSCRLR